MRLEGKRVVVTGAGGGSVRAFCTGLAREAAVACLDRDGESARDVAREVTEIGGLTVPINCDASDWSAMDASAAGIVDELGRIDVCVANA